MYQPPHFREDAIEALHGLIRAYPLGLLVSAGAGGLVANPIPFVIDAQASEKGTLRCLARANPRWRELQSVAECLEARLPVHGRHLGLGKRRTLDPRGSDLSNTDILAGPHSMRVSQSTGGT